MIYFTFSVILVSDLLILHVLVLLVHAIINHTAIYDVIADICLFTFFTPKLEVIWFKTKVFTLRD